MFLNHQFTIDFMIPVRKGHAEPCYISKSFIQTVKQSKGAGGRIGRFVSGEVRDLNLFRRAATINLSKRQLWRLVCLIWSALVVRTTWADLYYCQETGAVSIDPHQSSVIDEDSPGIAQRRWLVDTDRGWHRAEFPGYRGSCQIENGYVVCRTENIAFGEATLSIHPNGTSFVVVYTDYGLGALAIVGKCNERDAS